MLKAISLLALSMSLAAPHALAFKESGGGAQLEAAFRVRASELIAAVGEVPAADALCPADRMRAALQATSIRLVDQLIDADTGLPPGQPNLDAWTRPGLMELRREAWERYLGATSLGPVSRVDALILHEIYRSVGLGCDDEGFRISARIPALLTTPSKDSQIFSFTRRMESKEDLGFYHHNISGAHLTFCNGALVTDELLTCVVLWSRGGYQLENEIRILRGRIQKYLGEFVMMPGLDLVVNAASDHEFHRIENLLMMTTVTPEHPFHFVFDQISGDWSFGTDLNRLVTAKP